MAAPLLLHAAQGAVETTVQGGLTLALWALVAGIGLGAVVAVVHRPLFSRRVATVAIWLLGIIAVAQSVVPYDHLLEIAPHEHGAVHASHCHDTPASCADAPLTAGPGQLLTFDPLLPAPEVVLTLVVLAVPVLFGIVYRPRIRPPMLVVRHGVAAN